MSRYASRWALGATLSLAIALVANPVRSAPDPEEVKARQAAAKPTMEVVDALDMPGMEKKVASIVKNQSLDVIMGQFKPRASGGMGIGEKMPPAEVKDSIELAIIDLATKKKVPADLTGKSKDDLVKAARVTRAVAEITYGFTPTTKKPGKDPADWKKYTDDMKAGAKDLEEAAKAGDAKKIQDAAKKLSGSCTDCHNKFRDSGS